jgi:hypothetical protein
VTSLADTYKTWSGYRESNSDVLLGKQSGYLYIIPALNLAYLQGLEPRLTVLETAVLPLHQRYINLVLQEGLEPSSPDYKTGILAFEILEHLFGSHGQF